MVAIFYRRSLTALLALAATWVIASCPAALAASIPVNYTPDELDASPDENCSLREAVRSANDDMAVGGCAAGSGADTITVPAGMYPYTLTGSDDDAKVGDLDLRSPMTIQGAGQGAGAGDTIIDWTCAVCVALGGFDRVFHVLGPAAEVTLSSLRVRDGTAGGAYGGGILVAGQGELTMSDVTLTANRAGIWGGGLAVIDATATVERGNVSANRADSGGGLAVGNPSTNPALSTVTLEGTTIAGNDAENGGGIYNNGSLTATGIVVSGNGDNSGSMSIPQTRLGGGIYNGGPVFSLTDSTLGPSNQAYEEGGGLYNPGGGLAEVVLRRVRVTQNTAADPAAPGSGKGGGIHSTGPPLRLVESTVDKNVSDGEGGGVYDFSPGGAHTLTIERSTIGPGNRAIDGDGVAVVATPAEVQGPVTIDESTISGNEFFLTGGRGGGVYARSRPVTLHEVTFAGNAAGSSGSGGNVFAETGSTVVARNTLMVFSGGGPSCGTETGGTITSQGGNQEYTSGEAFSCGFVGAGDFSRSTLLSPAEFDYTLKENGGPTATHALFEAGPPFDGGMSCDAPDQRGVPRPQHGLCDVGAYELDTAPDTAIVSGPGGTIDGAQASFGFVADEPLAEFRCAVDGGTFVACQSPFTTPALGNGPHTFAVFAIDDKGVADATPATRAFTVALPDEDDGVPGAVPGGGSGKGGGRGGAGGEAGFGAKILVTLKLARRTIPAAGPVPVAVSNRNAFPVSGVLSGKATGRAGKLSPRRFRVPAGRTKSVRLKLPEGLRALLEDGETLRLRLVAKVVDPAGNERRVTKRVSPRS